ncbi:class I SAM-dependent methyltransferase [Mucilaginibacter paludis]|uniref:Methyltransferase type 11 n=1 Tax=Mucilaginibacter paludis DSM 18603 TaxID=714943 RepID=H1Y8Z8_9SPHI|nr:class I SAM-dependent methyltransferase [Mucilaginibacter paludis]EHQ29036.1 Methyltransferase type 11 [Mucilaginibacter paludis DSM 18603]
MPKKWFQNWFNSPYYHILYQQRNNAEAEFFIDNLCEYLKPSAEANLLDIACGRGRHSIYLNKKGYDITGIDLSIASIQYAKQFENSHLHFYVHDMRYLFYVNYFDIALNLFTSFGYFDTDYEHVKALKNFQKALKPDGLLVLDYFNSNKVLNMLCPQMIKTVSGVDFNIHKKIENDKIIKTIEFEDQNKPYIFKEEVKAFSMGDFKLFFEQSGFEISHCFGNYNLEEFDPANSDRLIFICKKAL